MNKNYLFGSRVVTHFAFWLMYYVLFGYIWANDGNYLASYFLEFVLLPVRMFAVYFTIYTLIPKFLKQRKLLAFAIGYLLLLLVSGLLQRLFTHFFYEGLFEFDSPGLFDINMIMRSVILINSTVVFVSAIKIALLWYDEQDKNQKLLKAIESEKDDSVEIKAEKRTFRVKSHDILFIEALGNYVKVVLKDQTIISYVSLKHLLDTLPTNFVRVHKSFIINKDHIKSYNYEDVQVEEHFIPIGRSFKSTLNI